jgi:O-antigen/teichoic acid export membrane protein
MTAVPLALAAGAVVPTLFGRTFDGAVVPAQILLIGLAAEGAAGVVTAFLYGRGRPGLNSVAAATGLVVTLILDVILIPRLGAIGAAIASSAAYLTTTLTLLAWYRHVTRSIPATVHATGTFDPVDARSERLYGRPQVVPITESKGSIAAGSPQPGQTHVR